MSLGRFETRLVASAKLTTMEKYGWAYNEDLMIVRENLGDEVRVIDDGTGVIKVCDHRGEFEVKIRDYQKKREHNVDSNGQKVIPGDPDRQGKYVSVWEVASH